MIEHVKQFQEVKGSDIIDPIVEKRRLLLAILDTNSAHKFI